MKSLLLLAPCLLLSLLSHGQKNYFSPSGTEAIAAIMGKECDEKVWSVSNDKVLRTYANGQVYELIDTAGLLIYVRVVSEEVTPTNRNKARYKAVTEGYFSKDGCSEIYRLNYGSLRKALKENTDFVSAAKSVPDEEYLNPSKDAKSTTINSLYRQHVRKQ